MRRRRLLIDGVDSLAIDPRSTSGQPDGWGWDWERWKQCPNNPIVTGSSGRA
jgi:hypothetical protein